MTLQCFITPFEIAADPARWEGLYRDCEALVEVGSFKTALKEQWPEAVLYEERFNVLLSWMLTESCPCQGAALRTVGHLYLDRKVVALDRPWLPFLLWYRAFIPTERRLWLSARIPASCFELTVDTTEADIRVTLALMEEVHTHGW
jgi:hypothetical protein